jgi:ATP-binding cassette, subfamily C (CFTR/MRP), member 1
MASFECIEFFLLGQSRIDLRQEHQSSTSTSIQIEDCSDEVIGYTQPVLIDLSAATLIDAPKINPSSCAELVLSNIKICLENSSVTMLAGPIGSSQSTLLKAILGEVPFTGNISLYPTTEGLVVERLLGSNGLTRKLGITIVLAIQASEFSAVANSPSV